VHSETESARKGASIGRETVTVWRREPSVINWISISDAMEIMTHLGSRDSTGFSGKLSGVVKSMRENHQRGGCFSLEIDGMTGVQNCVVFRNAAVKNLVSISRQIGAVSLWKCEMK
jgi:hypothetical protein